MSSPVAALRHPNLPPTSPNTTRPLAVAGEALMAHSVLKIQRITPVLDRCTIGFFESSD